jgi:hypothetical protein
MAASWRDDARCEVPSDWLDEGESDLYVPTVQGGFMREVVIHEQAYTRSRNTRPARSIYYHYFTKASEGSSVERVALLRAAANPHDADAEDTVEGFLRSQLCQDLLFKPSDFIFYDCEADGPGVLAAALPATPRIASACPSVPFCLCFLQWKSSLRRNDARTDTGMRRVQVQAALGASALLLRLQWHRRSSLRHLRRRHRQLQCRPCKWTASHSL